MTLIANEVINTLTKVLEEKGIFATKRELDLAIADVVKRTQERSSRGPQFSLSKMIRGMKAQQGPALNPQTAEDDVAYTKALTTGAQPGSYLVPTFQADEIIQYLATGGVVRAAGARIWPCTGINKLTVPVALASPTWIWMAQNSQYTPPSDPNLGQMAFDLKERRCLVAIPNQLLATSVPAFDTLIAELIGLAAGEHEDTALLSSSQVSGGPVPIYAAASTSTLLVGSSANGGNLAFTDILAVLQKASTVKSKPPFTWIMSPRTFYQRVLGMLDLSSRPIYIPTLSQGLEQGPGVGTVQSVGFLMGFPVFVSPMVEETLANGSGTNQSWILFTNMKYVHVAQDSNIEMAISTERFFDASQVAIRATQHSDAAVSPSAGVVILKGVN